MFRIPGAFWLATIYFVMGWLPKLVEAPWVPTALLVLLALMKALEVLVTPRVPIPAEKATRTETGLEMWVRWMVG